jgi:competence protein ComEA
LRNVKPVTTMADSPQQNWTRQKGLFVFSLLILGYLAFQSGLSDPKTDIGKNTLETARTVTIELTGPVSRPGLVTYHYNPSLQEVIEDAGGLTLAGGLSKSRRQEVLDQDMTLTVQGQGDGTVVFHRSPLSPKALWIMGRPIPINRAAAEDLGRLPGIGVKMAERIVVFREARGGFTALDQLKEVKGIKEKTFAKIKGHFIL